MLTENILIPLIVLRRVGYEIISALLNILIQGSSNACFADNLLSGLFVNNFLINFLASFEIPFHSYPTKFT
jgi:hypothetical protein